MRLATLQAQTEELNSELEALLAAIPKLAPDAGEIDEGEVPPLPRRHPRRPIGTALLPGGNNIGPDLLDLWRYWGSLPGGDPEPEYRDWSDFIPTGRGGE